MSGLLFLFLSLSLAYGESSAPPDLVVYAYDSFMSEGGLGPAIVPLFEKKCHCRVQVLPSGDSAQVLTRVELDRTRRREVADVILGVDQFQMSRADSLLQSWGGWVPRGFERVAPEFKKALSSATGTKLLPFDYGVFSLITKVPEGKKSVEGEISLQELLLPEWKRSLLIEDPRTSGPGLAFLLFTKSVLGEKWLDYWKSLKTQWLTLTPGWDAAYSLFLKGEGRAVWSYSSSQAYHAEHPSKTSAAQYRALYFKEGQPLQIEGLGIVTSDLKRKKIAQEFLEFMISSEVQRKVPATNWMFPVTSVALPKSFRNISRPHKMIWLSGVTELEVKEALKQWSLCLSQ